MNASPFRRLCRAVASLVAASSVASAMAAGVADVGPSGLEVEQRLGQSLPLDAAFVDSHGTGVRLDALFAQAATPVILVPGYFRCAGLCQTLLPATLESLAKSGLPADSYRLVAFSIDPGEDATVAAARETTLRAWATLAMTGAVSRGGLPSMRLLVGDAEAIARLARSIGFAYRRSGDPAQPYVHPAAVVVVAADGRISRYLLGVAPAPAALREAVETAADGRTGSLAERISLLCAHLDPTLGARSGLVLEIARGVGLLALAALLWLLLRLRAPRRAARVGS